MEIKILGGTGLHASERKAVQRMEAELRDSWFAYASLLIVDDQGSMDVDTLIITHDRLLLVELKEWNGKLESCDGQWIMNGKPRGKSPYEIKRVHAIRISKLIQREIQHKLGYFPIVEAHVVLCGTATPEYLSTTERRFVHTLDDFLKVTSTKGYDKIVADQQYPVKKIYEQLGKPRPNSEKCLPIIKDFFAGPQIKPKNFVHYNYVTESNCWFTHRTGLYEEYKGHHQERPNLHSLVRRWNFNRLGTGNATQNQWASVGLRESRLLNYIKDTRNQLEEYMLRPLIPIAEEDVTEDLTELFELRRTYQRFDEFLAKESASWSIEKRIDITRALIIPFAELHGLGLGHRDIDSHNLWFAAEQQSIVVSGFATAFFPERGTIKDLRQIIQSSYIKLPEDEFSVDGDILDPFKQDVYMLAILAYQICYGGSMPPKEDGIFSWLPASSDPFETKLNKWFKSALSWEIDARFSSATEMLAEFNSLTLKTSPLNEDRLEVFDEVMSDDFVKREWNSFTVYQYYPPMPGEMPGVGQKMVYKSLVDGSIYICKIWPQIQVSPDNPGLNRRLLHFKRRLTIINSAKLAAPKLHDHGLLEGGGLLVVSQYIEGGTWREFDFSQINSQQRHDVALSLITAVLGFHNKGLAHGDLHPCNIILNNSQHSNGTDDPEDIIKLFLIDVVDFGEEATPYNTEYGPENPARSDSFGRDRFAVYKLIEELFGEDIHPLVKDEITLNKKINEDTPISLEPINDAIKKAMEPVAEAPIKDCIDISWVSQTFPEYAKSIDQDEGNYYFNCKWDNRQSDVLISYITGINAQIQIQIQISSKIRKIVRVNYKENIALSEVVSASSKSQLKIQSLLNVSKGRLEDKQESKLLNFILGLEPILDLLVAKYSNDTETNVDQATIGQSKNFLSSDIWQALLSTEEDLLQSIEINDDEIEENNHGYLMIPYVQNYGKSLNFEVDDQVFVSIQGEDSDLGEVVLMATNLDVLALKPKRTYVRRLLKKGVILNLESIRTKASRNRKEKALLRVLSGGAVISDLPKHFDDSINTEKATLEQAPTELEIRNLYDSNEYQMNAKQILAFQQLFSHGPVGVLQGPPGTGKTSFISKFIHYLYTKGGAKNVLLVGQSHTAVDNVAIKVREVCSSKGMDLNIVRIGHETMIDEELLHAHPAALQRQIRQKFHREYEQRIRDLGRQLLLPLTLVDELAFLHRILNPLLENRKHLYTAKDKLVSVSGGASSENIEHLDEKIIKVESRLSKILDKRFNCEYQPVFEQIDIWDSLAYFVAVQHGVNNPAALNRLKGLLFLSQEWMDVLHTGEANYDRFMVKTKELVCGTLVGMGLKRIEIEDIEFDWVIVDEAGRAQASELMIALQTAKRVLLVGDQKQLPPFYEKEHLKLASKKLNTDISTFADSDFYRAFKANNGVTLDTQYRMVKPISDIISNCFYADEIDELITDRKESPEWFNSLPFPWNTSVTWVDSSEGEGEVEREKGKYINVNELSIIKSILQDLANQSSVTYLSETITKEQPFPIGIITMYRAQKDLIENELSKAEWATPLRHLIKIDTVDSYQGQENKIIILSLVRDNKKSIQGFLGDAPRINVAISRAQERLIILGASRMWTKGNNDSALGTVYEFIKRKVECDELGYQIANFGDVCRDVRND